jgi:hypothetical protein
MANVSVNGKVLARMPCEEWFQVELEAVLGQDVTRYLGLTLIPKRAAPQIFRDLPITGKDFHQVHWLGCGILRPGVCSGGSQLHQSEKCCNGWRIVV